MLSNNVVTKPFLVTDIQLLGANTYRVNLCCEEGEVPVYSAGQYLEILLPGGDACAFSIASAPLAGQRELELHIQRLVGRENSDRLFTILESGKVTVRMPKGFCYADQLPDKPILLIAAGTGFAQMKSIAEHCLNLGHQQGIHLYWGARAPTDFYLPSLPIQWVERGIHYHPVVSDVSGSDDWCGRYGLLYEAILADKDELKNAEVYISGSPGMVYATVDAITKVGFAQENIHSDVFEYAPRGKK
ncbi:NAD(P)H-flavin reductase [Endozoicomonas sp. Mp262]|uniref:NAD(P)H-flavin reductase n=1 Tax=Endozoicomonas sp. Mp262 TaxID=2919499 RepID=UPI0021DA0DEA